MQRKDGYVRSDWTNSFKLSNESRVEIRADENLGWCYLSLSISLGGVFCQAWTRGHVIWPVGEKLQSLFFWSHS